MQNSYRCLAFIALLIPCASARDIELKWNEIAAVAVGHEVHLKLPDGGTVSGEALAIRQESLEINVRSASNPSQFPKGQASIPRASVSIVEVHKSGGATGKVVGTIIGAFAGMVGGGEIVAHSNMSEGPALTTWFLTSAGASTAGYLAGRSLDRRITRIRVVP